MDLHIRIDLQDTVLVVTASGNIAFDSALRLFKQVFDTALASRITKILVNALTADGELAGFERYQLGTILASYLAERQMRFKLAIVGTPPTVTGFTVRLLQNRDIVARTFARQQEALSWLQGSEDAA